MDLRQQLQATLGTAYTLERELGGGGMSHVFVATEKALGRKVVVKVLPPELTQGVSVERFKREIQLAAQLQHPHIVPVHASGETDGVPYYTMPLVDGTSLRARLAQGGPLPIGETVGILREVAKALVYAHERGVVHRDIKPDNVLITGGTAVVTDFGIAKALSASRTTAPGGTLTQIGTSIGTPAYMAPEQAAADPSTDHRADIYSFGCMAYEMLAGRPPFVANTPHKLLAAQMGETAQPIVELRADTPPLLAELVTRCLEKDPDNRPQSAVALVKVLDDVTSGGAHTAMPAILLGGRPRLLRALAVYAVAFIVVAIIARAAIVGIGLPDWVFPGALVVMALGLPVILFTGYAQYVTRVAMTTSPTTPGGTPSVATQGTMAAIALKAGPHVSWRRTTVGGAYALGAFVLLVGAFMALRSLGIGPAGSLLSRGRLGTRDALLITDFKTQGADTNLGNVVTEAVRADLGQSAAISLVPPVTVAAALGRMQRPASTKVDLAVAREMAVREGIKAIVDGEITPLGAGYVIAVRLVSADSGLELTSARTVVATPTDLIDGINKVSRQLRGKIGESLRSVQASPPLARVTTSSLEALRKYTEGIRANRETDYAGAVALFRQAVALDSTFATAWTAMATAMANGRPFPQSQQDSAQSMAYRFRDRMTAAGRASMEARYFYTGPGRDRRRALALYEAVFARDSNPNAANIMGIILMGLGENARAESLFVWAIQVAPDMTFPYGNIVFPLFNQGKTREAEAAIALARKRHPSYLTGVIFAARMRYHEGDLVAYGRALDSLRASGVPRLRTTGAYSLAGLAMLTGRLQEAERRLAEARGLDAAGGQAASPLVDSIAVALVDAWFREQPQRAARRLDESLARHPLKSIPLVDRPYFALASAYATAKRPDRAREILRQFSADADTTLRRATESAVAGVLGDIALAEGKPREAIDQFRRAQNALIRTTRPDPSLEFARIGRAFDLAHESDSAIGNFERFLSTPSWDRTAPESDPLYLAAVHKRLGELYEAKGDKQKASGHYVKFIELWKNADPELQPKVDDVRKRLARLSDTEKR